MEAFSGAYASLASSDSLEGTDRACEALKSANVLKTTPQPRCILLICLCEPSTVHRNAREWDR